MQLSFLAFLLFLVMSSVSFARFAIRCRSLLLLLKQLKFGKFFMHQQEVFSLSSEHMLSIRHLAVFPASHSGRRLAGCLLGLGTAAAQLMVILVDVVHFELLRLLQQVLGLLPAVDGVGGFDSSGGRGCARDGRWYYNLTCLHCRSERGLQCLIAAVSVAVFNAPELFITDAHGRGVGLSPWQQRAHTLPLARD